MSGLSRRIPSFFLVISFLRAAKKAASIDIGSLNRVSGSQEAKGLAVPKKCLAPSSRVPLKFMFPIYILNNRALMIVLAWLLFSFMMTSADAANRKVVTLVIEKFEKPEENFEVLTRASNGVGDNVDDSEDIFKSNPYEKLEVIQPKYHFNTFGYAPDSPPLIEVGAGSNRAGGLILQNLDAQVIDDSDWEDHTRKQAQIIANIVERYVNKIKRDDFNNLQIYTSLLAFDSLGGYYLPYVKYHARQDDIVIFAGDYIQDRDCSTLIGWSIGHQSICYPPYIGKFLVKDIRNKLKQISP
jgi:hypothetical protein